MKRFVIIAFSLVCVVLTVSGCDFFRKLAGRPTSSDIKVLAMAILNGEKQEELRQQRLLEAQLREQEAADSTIDSLAAAVGAEVAAGDVPDAQVKDAEAPVSDAKVSDTPAQNVKVSDATAPEAKADTSDPTAYYEACPYRKTVYDPAVGRYSTVLDKKYYLIIGFFSVQENAEKLVGSMKDKGFSPEIIAHTNGKQSVALIAADSITDLVKDLKKAEEAKVCPKDAWILVNKNK